MPAEKVLDQTLARMAVETADQARSAQIAAVHARTTEAVRPKGSTRERKSSAAGAGSCGPLTGHDRRQQVASRALPKSGTLQERNSRIATRKWRLQNFSARDAIRIHTKGKQEQG